MLWSKYLAVIFPSVLLSYFLGMILIPLLRKHKTGKYDAVIGDRFKTDGSEPAFGGGAVLLVFVFALIISSGICGESSRLMLTAGFCILITLTGIAEDYMTDIRKQSFGIKPWIKNGWCFCCCMLYVMLLKLLGFTAEAVLLPFHMGTADLGVFWYPVSAFVMTAVINCFCLHERFGVDDKSSCGGLCAVTAVFAGLSFYISGIILSDSVLSNYANSLSAAASGSLIWGLSPSKLKYGSSGGFFFGAAAAAGIVLSPFMLIAALFAVLPAVTDAVCTALQFLVFSKTRKLFLKGSSLHSHLSAVGMNDYKIIIIFSIISAVGAVLNIIYSVYAVSII